MKHELTEQMRSSGLPYFVGLRRSLASKGIDPQTAALAKSFEDDVNLEFGVVVSEDGRIYQFDYVYDDDQIERGDITTWTEVPRTWSRLADESEIIAAVRFLGLSIDL